MSDYETDFEIVDEYETNFEVIEEMPRDRGIAGDIVAFQKGAADTMTIGAGEEMKAGIQSLVRGGLDPNVTIGQAYDHFLDKARTEADAAQAESPYMYGAGQVAGAVIPALALPQIRGVAEFAKRGPLQAGAAAAGLGGASGGIYGAGSGRGGAQERMEEAMRLGGIGAVAGPVGLGAARVAQLSLGPLAKRAQSLFKKQPALAKTADELIETQTAAPVVDDVAPAYSKVKKALQKDFGDDFDNVISAYKNGDMSISDFYGKRSTSLAEASALFPTGREIASDAIESKTSGSYDRLLSSIRKNVSGVDSYFTTAEDLVNAGRAKAAPLYAEAYEDVIQNKDILKVPEVQSALKKAYKQFPTQLKNAEPDSIQALDYAKKILDDDIGEAMRKGKGNFAGSRTEIKNALLQEMDASSPAYSKARAKAGDYLSVQSAMDAGKNALKEDPELVTKTFKSLSEKEQDAYKIGLGKALRDQLNKVREGANPFNRILKSPEQQNRLRAILSPKEYENLSNSLKAENRLFEFRNTVLGGSPTARREEAKTLIESGAIDTITGVPQQTFREGIKKLRTQYLGGINDKTAAKISDILYETDPVKKLKIINEMGKKSTLTKTEIETVKKAYSVMSPRFDALYASPPSGLSAAALAEDKPLEVTVRPDPTTENFPDTE